MLVFFCSAQIRPKRGPGSVSPEQQIHDHIEAHFQSVDGRVKVALFHLMRCHADVEARGDRELNEVLDAFLDAANVPSLKTGLSHVYVSRFLFSHPRTAAFQFFKDARKKLPDSDYAAIRYWFIDTLLIESWPRWNLD